jgi:hypothetical protein
VRIKIAAILTFVGGAIGVVIGPIVVASTTDEVLVVIKAEEGVSTGEEYNQVAHIIGKEAAGTGDS